MPRVSDEYRDARRSEIAAAAVRCMGRNGVHNTSIADIVAESGLSTGAVYSHFTSKAEIARYAVDRYLLVRVDALDEAARRGTEVTPSEVIQSLLGAPIDAGISPGLVLQFWAEAMLAGELAETVRAAATRLHGSIAASLMNWARRRTDGEAAARSLAAVTARAAVAVIQGFVANNAVFGEFSREDYLAALPDVLDDGSA